MSLLVRVRSFLEQLADLHDLLVRKVLLDESLTQLGDRVVARARIFLLNQSGVGEFIQTPVEGRTSNVHFISGFQIVDDRSGLEGDTGVCEEAQNWAVYLTHPEHWAHLVPMRPDPVLVVGIAFSNGLGPPIFGSCCPNSGTVLSHTYKYMGVRLVLTTDAVLFGVDFAEKESVPASQRGHRVGYTNRMTCCDNRELKTPGTTDAPLATECPVCGQPVDGIAADGSRGAVTDPCGHSIADLTVAVLQTRE